MTASSMVLEFFNLTSQLRRTDVTLMSVLLFVHLKNDIFSISLPSPLYLSLTHAFTYLIDFLNACNKLGRLCVVAGTSNSKNPKLYYSAIQKYVHLFFFTFWNKASKIVRLEHCKSM